MVVLVMLIYQLELPEVPTVLMERVGDVKSIFTVLVTVVVLPALSIARNWTECDPSDSVAMEVHEPVSIDTEALASPEPASEPLDETYTGPVTTHPFKPLAAGKFGVKVGATESTFMVRDSTAETFPATSTVRKFTVYMPLGKKAVEVCHAPPFI